MKKKTQNNWQKLYTHLLLSAIVVLHHSLSNQSAFEVIELGSQLLKLFSAVGSQIIISNLLYFLE